MEIAGSAARSPAPHRGSARPRPPRWRRGASVHGLDLEKALVGATAPDGVMLMPADVTEEAGLRTALGGSTTTGSSCGSR